MSNLLDSKNYKKATGSLWNSYRNEPSNPLQPILNLLNTRQVLQEILIMLVMVKMVMMQTNLAKIKLK